MKQRRRTAFTLVELLVTLSLIAMLMSLLLPVLAAARTSARTAVCGSNLRQLGVAGHMYVDDHDDRFWRYYQDLPDGRQWWFGFEPASSDSSQPGRPLDLTRSVFGAYLATQGEHFQCPSFPYDRGNYRAKFARRAASYGYNVRLGGGVMLSEAPHQRMRYDHRASETALFADGIHFDAATRFNEGHYLLYTTPVGIPSGYAHFRHQQRAQVLYLDGHVERQALQGPSHRTVDGSPSGNLASPDGSNRIYGF